VTRNAWLVLHQAHYDLLSFLRNRQARFFTLMLPLIFILGYAISTAIGSADGAQPMVQAIMLPLYFISGVFIPNVNLPGWLQDVAKAFPVQHLADGLHKAFDPATHGVGIVWSDIGVLGLWAAVGLVVALGRFSWSPAAARA